MTEPRDEWEPADSDAEGDPPATGGGQPAAGAPVAITTEQSATLKTLEDSGMSLAEMTARARRDLQAEQARLQPAADGQPPAGLSPTASAADPDQVLTVGEAEKLMDQAANKARESAMETSVQSRLASVVETEISGTAGFGDSTPSDEVLLIKNRVGRNLMQNVRYREMSAMELDREVRRQTKEVLAKRRSEHRQSGAADGGSEAERRASHQRDSAPGGPRGGSGKRSAQETTRRGGTESKHDFANLRFGLQGNYPTSEEMAANKEAELNVFFKEQNAGR